MQPVISWQQDWRKVTGVPVKSPVSGQVLSISHHPEPLYQQDILAAAVCVRLEQGQIVAPFSGIITTSLEVERRIQFQHQSGLRLVLELPAKLAKLNGRGLHWLTPRQQQLSPAAPVLQLDLAFLQLELDLDDLYCMIFIDSPTPITKLFCRQAQVSAGQDPIFVMQLKKIL